MAPFIGVNVTFFIVIAIIITLSRALKRRQLVSFLMFLILKLPLYPIIKVLTVYFFLLLFILLFNTVFLLIT